MRCWGLSVQDQEELWRRWRQGESLRLIAAGWASGDPRYAPSSCGGVQRDPPRRARRCLSMAEREDLAVA